MADKKKMSVADILAACRQADGQGETTGPSASSEAGSGGSTRPTAASERPAPERAAPAPAKKPGEMSVADILAAARGGTAAAAKGGADKPAPQPAAAAKPASPGDGPAKKPTDMSVADILAAARGGGGKPAPAAPAAAPATTKAPKAPVAKADTPKKGDAPAKSAAAGSPDTSSILAAARAAKPGPMTKDEARQKGLEQQRRAQPEAPALPPPPVKPDYAKAPPKKTAVAVSARRDFLSVFVGSFLAVGFTSLTLTHLMWLLGLARFMFPNILTEPPSRFKIGFPADFSPGAVNTNYIAQFGVWVVNTDYEGQPQIFALRSVCTHLGCTPNWLEAEQKFKCPCHGSGFYKDGVNFEGPAPRPLERYAIRLADDGQLEVDKSRTFQQELGGWSDTSSFVPV